MKKLFIIVFTVLGLASYSQMMPLNNEYIANQFLINPALAGENDNTTVSLMSRMQWLGISDAPMSQCFSLDGRIKAKGRYNHTGKVIRRSKVPRTGRVGLGGYIFNDINSPFRRTILNFTYAYHLRMGKKRNHKISLGLGVSAYFNNLNHSEFVATDMTDPHLTANENLIFANLNFGGNYQLNNYFFGISALNLIPQSIQFSEIQTDPEKNITQVFARTGLKLRDSEKFTFIPSLIYNSYPGNFDVCFSGIFGKKFELSLCYHTIEAASVFLSMNFKKLRIQYSYQYSTGEINTYNNGSQLFALSYTF